MVEASISAEKSAAIRALRPFFANKNTDYKNSRMAETRESK